MSPETRAVVRKYGLNPDTATEYQLDCLQALLRAEGALHHAHADFLDCFDNPDGPPEACRATLQVIDGGVA